MPVEDRLDVFFRRAGISDREEAEASEVYSVEGDVGTEDVARCAQEGAVSAEDDGEGDLFAPRLVRNFGKGDRGGLVRRQQKMHAIFFAPAPEPPGHFYRFGLLRVE